MLNRTVSILSSDMNIIDSPAQCTAFDSYLSANISGRFVRGEAISHSEAEWDAFQAGWNAALANNVTEYTRLLAHLQSRHLDVSLHKPYISPETSTITFWLWNCSKQLVGYQQYRPDASKMANNNPRYGRYFTYKTPGTVAVWGTESLCYSGPVFVCEGIFDAARLTEKRKPAIAVLTSSPDQSTRNFLKCIGRPTIAVCDSDVAGQRLAKIATAAVVVETGDLGSAPPDFVEYLIVNSAEILQRASSAVYN